MRLILWWRCNFVRVFRYRRPSQMTNALSPLDPAPATHFVTGHRKAGLTESEMIGLAPLLFCSLVMLVAYLADSAGRALDPIAILIASLAGSAGAMAAMV